MTTRVLFFGSLKDVAGGAERVVELPVEIDTRAALITWLCNDDARLAAALSDASVKLCLDQKMVSSPSWTGAPEEIAFLPAFSGG